MNTNTVILQLLNTSYVYRNILLLEQYSTIVCNNVSDI